MNVLLDTHAFLWFVLNDPRLSATAKAAIEDPANVVLVSPASYWETAIKISVGKYHLNRPYDEFWQRGMQGANMTPLPIEVSATPASSFHCRSITRTHSIGCSSPRRSSNKSR